MSKKTPTNYIKTINVYEPFVCNFIKNKFEIKLAF